MTQIEDLSPRLLIDLFRDRFHPKKSLGQHLLVDSEVIDHTIKLACKSDNKPLEGKKILEIGPGAGSLTLGLLKEKSKVFAIEIDDDAISHLDRIFKNIDGDFELIHGDALSVKWPEGIKKIISNIPYQISSPILSKIGQYHSQNPLESIILLIQDEFASRMAMSDGEYDMGPLGLNLWLDFNIILDKKVHPSSFIPQPKVNSRLIIMEPVNREETKELDKNLFRIITKHCFSNRRRKISTLLSKVPSRLSRVRNWHKSRWKNKIKNILNYNPPGFDSGWTDLRPDRLTVQQWIILVKEIGKP